MQQPNPGQSIDAAFTDHDRRIAELEAAVEAIANRTRTKTWYTRAEAADYLNISITKLWELRSAGRLIGHQIDGRPVFHVDDLDALAQRDAPVLKVAS